MNPPTRVFFAGAVAILLFDVVASIASKALGFPYPYATVGSIIIYAGVGYFAARVGSFPLALTATLGVGVVEATIGWWLSWLIGPGRPASGSLTTSMVVAALITVLILAGVCGSIGALLGRARSTVSANAP